MPSDVRPSVSHGEVWRFRALTLRSLPFIMASQRMNRMKINYTIVWINLDLLRSFTIDTPAKSQIQGRAGYKS